MTELTRQADDFTDLDPATVPETRLDRRNRRRREAFTAILNGARWTVYCRYQHRNVRRAPSKAFQFEDAFVDVDDAVDSRGAPLLHVGLDCDLDLGIDSPRLFSSMLVELIENLRDRVRPGDRIRGVIMDLIDYLDHDTPERELSPVYHRLSNILRAEQASAKAARDWNRDLESFGRGRVSAIIAISRLHRLVQIMQPAHLDCWASTLPMVPAPSEVTFAHYEWVRRGCNWAHGLSGTSSYVKNVRARTRAAELVVLKHMLGVA